MTVLKHLLKMRNNFSSMASQSFKPLSIIVEGNIASGKTTFLDYFRKDDEVAIIKEPVDLWRNCRGHNLLDLMYKDPKKWAFPFQMYAALTMLQRHTMETYKPINLMERSIYSARYCFVEKLVKDGILLPEHYAIIDEHFKWATQSVNMSVDLIVYLRSSPEVAYRRMMLRGRNEEIDVPFDYLLQLHNYHENWLYKKSAFQVPAPVLTLNADLEVADIDDEYKKFESIVMDKAIAQA